MSDGLQPITPTEAVELHLDAMKDGSAEWTQTSHKSDLRAAVYPQCEDEVYWDNARVMWESIGRYLEDNPGIKKGGYGEWAYTGDDEVRKAVKELK